MRAALLLMLFDFVHRTDEVSFEQENRLAYVALLIECILNDVWVYLNGT